MKEKQNQKSNIFVRFLKRVFVYNWDLKLGAIALGMFIWLLFIIAY